MVNESGLDAVVVYFTTSSIIFINLARFLRCSKFALIFLLFLVFRRVADFTRHLFPFLCRFVSEVRLMRRRSLSFGDYNYVLTTAGERVNRSTDHTSKSELVRCRPSDITYQPHCGSLTVTVT
jgi:hypothetical protein